VLPDAERFDLVTLTHVLEHLLNPISVLERLRHALADGVLLVEVPNADDRLLKAWGGRYRPLCPGDHVSFFSESSLTTLLSAAGFDVVEMRSPTHARDLVYPSLLSTVDALQRSATPSGTAQRSEHGVLSSARYRGRLRVPLRRAVDLLCEKVDPLVVSLFSDTTRTGPVLVATARPRPH
jgi:SAM-dependent methyltransferase